MPPERSIPTKTRPKTYGKEERRAKVLLEARYLKELGEGRRHLANPHPVLADMPRNHPGRPGSGSDPRPALEGILHEEMDELWLNDHPHYAPVNAEAYGLVLVPAPYDGWSKWRPVPDVKQASSGVKTWRIVLAQREIRCNGTPALFPQARLRSDGAIELGCCLHHSKIPRSSPSCPHSKRLIYPVQQDESNNDDSERESAGDHEESIWHTDLHGPPAHADPFDAQVSSPSRQETDSDDLGQGSDSGDAARLGLSPGHLPAQSSQRLVQPAQYEQLVHQVVEPILALVARKDRLIELYCGILHSRLGGPTREELDGVARLIGPGSQEPTPAEMEAVLRKSFKPGDYVEELIALAHYAPSPESSS